MDSKLEQVSYFADGNGRLKSGSLALAKRDERLTSGFAHAQGTALIFWGEAWGPVNPNKTSLQRCATTQERSCVHVHKRCLLSMRERDLLCACTQDISRVRAHKRSVVRTQARDLLCACAMEYHVSMHARDLLFACTPYLLFACTPEIYCMHTRDLLCEIQIQM